MRILIIEDDIDVASSVALVLEHEGHDMLIAYHGRQAVEILSSVPPPRLIFLDLMMPVMNGWEFRRWQQQQPQLARIPVVLLSASDAIQVSADFLGVAAYLRKPFQVEQLLRTVKRFVMDETVDAARSPPI